MTLTEYRERLHEYKQDFLLCKDIRHVWRVTTPFTNTAEDNTWVYRVLTCQRCSTARTDYFRLHANTNRLERGYSSYRYPSGFSMRGLPEEGRLSEVMRFESYLRALQAPDNRDN
jgi:hypothetical protein